MSSKVFWIFFDQIKIPIKRKQNAETFFQRELSLRYVLLFIINFYEQFLKLN